METDLVGKRVQAVMLRDEKLPEGVGHAIILIGVVRAVVYTPAGEGEAGEFLLLLELDEDRSQSEKKWQAGALYPVGVGGQDSAFAIEVLNPATQYPYPDLTPPG